MPDPVVHQSELGYVINIGNETVNLNITVLKLVNDTKIYEDFTTYLTNLIVDEDTVKNETIQEFLCTPLKAP